MTAAGPAITPHALSTTDIIPCSERLSRNSAGYILLALMDTIGLRLPQVCVNITSSSVLEVLLRRGDHLAAGLTLFVKPPASSQVRRIFPEALGLGHTNDLPRVGVEMQGLSCAVSHVTQVAKERTI